MNIEEAINKYINYISGVMRVSENTETAYKNDLLQFLEFCESKNILEFDKLSERFIRSFIIKLNSEKIAASSISRKLASVRGFINFCLEQKLIFVNPLQYIKNPKVNRKLPETVSHNSIESIFNIINNSNIGNFDKLLFISIIDLTYTCALRVSELCNLRVNELDTNSFTVRILGKGSKLRIVPISSKTIRNIKNYLMVRPANNNEYLFLLKNGNPIYSKYVYRIINKYLSLVSDNEKKSPHVLRHASATHMLDAGADLMAVKEILGHENLSTTQIYTHVSIERLKNTYKTAHPKS
ncbi:MAG TPA: tyrosine-type recombinase/integrase [Melioribacteraceae bacterium]|nr:tyrosine-type recombinase/integrase [Melioribacteraceae bacterium]